MLFNTVVALSLLSIGAHAAVSKDARCGREFGGATCQGSRWGNCCSQYGYCGTTKDHCDAKTCQKNFGTCNGSPVGTTLTTLRTTAPSVPQPTCSATTVTLPQATTTVTVPAQAQTTTVTVPGQDQTTTIRETTTIPTTIKEYESTTVTIPTTVTLPGEPETTTLTVPGEGEVVTVTEPTTVVDSTTVTIPTTVTLPGEETTTTLISATTTTEFTTEFTTIPTTVSVTESTTITEPTTTTEVISTTITDSTTITEPTTTTLTEVTSTTLTEVSATTLTEVTSTTLTEVSSTTLTEVSSTTVIEVSTFTEPTTTTEFSTIRETETSTIQLSASTVTVTGTETETVSTCVPSSCPTNPVVNGDFEDALANTWSVSSSSNVVWVESGNYLKVTSGSSNGEQSITQSVTVCPNSRYKVSFTRRRVGTSGDAFATLLVDNVPLAGSTTAPIMDQDPAAFAVAPAFGNTAATFSTGSKTSVTLDLKFTFNKSNGTPKVIHVDDVIFTKLLD